jgi:hypothetical protein
MTTIESQYTKEECKVIELEQICLICREQNKDCEWIETEENGCYTFCCTTCYINKHTDDTGYWGMRGCCKCGEETRHNLIMSTCVCEKYFTPLVNYTFSHSICAKVTTFLIHNCPQSGRFE